MSLIMAASARRLCMPRVVAVCTGSGAPAARRGCRSVHLFMPRLRPRALHTARAVRSSARDAPAGRQSTRASTPKKGVDKLGVALFGSLVAATFGLGCWQVQRYYWKVGLVEAVESRLRSAVVPVTSELDRDGLFMKQVVVRGRFDHRREVFVGPRCAPHNTPHELTNGEKSGFYVFTPFETTDGAQIMVNRGWVGSRKGRGDAVVRPTGVVEFHGVVRANEEKRPVTPENDFPSAAIFWADVEEFARRAGFRSPETTGLIDAVEPIVVGQYPIPKRLDGFAEFHVMPFKHQVYATTWFSLFIAGFVMTFLMFRRGRPGMGKSVRPGVFVDETAARPTNPSVHNTWKKQ